MTPREIAVALQAQLNGERGRSIAISLLLDGTLVTGTLLNRDDWVERFSAQVSVGRVSTDEQILESLDPEFEAPESPELIDHLSLADTKVFAGPNVVAIPLLLIDPASVRACMPFTHPA